MCLAEVGPKKILDLMNVPWLTRENVASHLQVIISLLLWFIYQLELLTRRLKKGASILSGLVLSFLNSTLLHTHTNNIYIYRYIYTHTLPLQCSIIWHDYSDLLKERSGQYMKFYHILRSFLMQKYRLYLSRLQKENNLKTACGGMKHSDLSPKESSGIYDLSNLTNMHQNDDASDPQKARSSQMSFNHSLRSTEQDGTNSQMGFNHSFGSTEQDVTYAAFNSSIPAQFYWSGEEVPDTELQGEQRPSIQSETSFNQLPLPGPQCHDEVDFLQPTLPPISPGSSTKERDKASTAKIKPLYASQDGNHDIRANSTGSEIDLFSIQSKRQMVKPQALEPISSITMNMRNQGHNQSPVNNLESFQRNMISWSGSALESLEDSQVRWLQGDCSPVNFGPQNIEFSDYHDQKLLGEVPFHLYDPFKLDYENLSDLTEYPIMDQGLFIV